MTFIFDQLFIPHSFGFVLVINTVLHRFLVHVPGSHLVAVDRFNFPFLQWINDQVHVFYGSGNVSKALLCLIKHRRQISGPPKNQKGSAVLDFTQAVLLLLMMHTV